MWTKKEEERNPQRAAVPTTPRPVDPRPAAPAPPAVSYSAQPAASPSGASVIGPSVVIRGDIIAQEDLYVNGSLEGTVQLDGHRIAIGPRGKVSAEIAAREVVIQGSVKGNIHATEKIIIKTEGTLAGDVHVAGIVIEDGAYFKGSIDIIRPQPAAQPAPAAKAAAAATVVS